MSVSNESSAAPSLRRVPFSVCLAPQFVNSLCAILPEEDDVSEKMDGLLFGMVETDFPVLRVFRLFPADLDSDDQDSFRLFLKESKKDPQTAGLVLLGWFSVRSITGLRTKDVAFHARYFDKPNDVALIIKSEPDSKLSFEVYCRAGDGSFSGEKHRWGSTRISTALPLLSPIGVPLAPKAREEIFVPDRQVRRSFDDDEPAAAWNDPFAANTKRGFESLSPIGAEQAAVKADTSGVMRDFEKPETQEWHGSDPFTPASPVPTRGGAAAAPALIPKDNPETQASTETAAKPVRPEPAGPQIVSAPKQKQTPPEVPNFRQAVLVRSEEHPPTPAGDHLFSKAKPSSLLPEPDRASEPPIDFRQMLSAELSSYGEKAARTTPWRAMPWRTMVIVFAVAATGTFALIYLKSAGANGRLPGALQSLWPTPGLNLKLSSVGDRLQLSWNRNTPPVQSAREGTLEISDGPSHHQIHLGGAEVANGSVLYLPSTDDVVFRLDVHGKTGQNLSESLRVVGNARSPTLQVSRPEEERPDTPAVPMGTVDSNAQNPAGKKEAEVSRKGLPTPKLERPRNGDLRAANSVTAAPGSTSALDVGLASQPPPVSKSEAAAVEGRGSEAPRPNGDGTKIVAENRSQPGSSPGPDSTVQQSSDVAKKSSAPALNTPENARPPEPAAQTVPAQNSEAKAVPEQTSTPAPVQNGATRPADTPVLSSYRPPRPVKQVLPKLNTLPPGVADSAGEVRIIVSVDESGRVTDARLAEGSNKVGSMLGGAALNAARQWVFEPAALHGKNIPSNHTILFQFRH